VHGQGNENREVAIYRYVTEGFPINADVINILFDHLKHTYYFLYALQSRSIDATNTGHLPAVKDEEPRWCLGTRWLSFPGTIGKV
jgi:hypothetical protein